MKPCPFCGEKIQSAAVKCRFCFEWLDPSRRPAWSDAAPPEPARGPTDPRSPPAGRWQPTPQVERWNNPGTIIMGSDVTGDAMAFPEEIPEPRDRTSPGVPLPTAATVAVASAEPGGHFDRLRRSAEAARERDRHSLPPDDLPPLPDSPFEVSAAASSRTSMRPGDLRAGPQVVRIPTPMSSPTTWRSEPDDLESNTVRRWQAPAAVLGPDVEPMPTPAPVHVDEVQRDAGIEATPDYDEAPELDEAYDEEEHDDESEAENEEDDSSKTPLGGSSQWTQADPSLAVAEVVEAEEEEDVESQADDVANNKSVDAFEAAFFGDDLEEDEDSETATSDLAALVAPRKPLPWIVPAGIGVLLMGGAFLMFGDRIFGATPSTELVDEPAVVESPDQPVAAPAAPAVPEPAVVTPNPHPVPAQADPAKLSEDDAVKLEQARESYKKHQLAETRQLLDELLAKYPRAGEVLVLLAQVQLEQGDAKAALKTASTCVEVETKAADCWLTVAVLEQDSGGIDRAMTAWERYLELAPDGAYARDADRELKRLRAKSK